MPIQFTCECGKRYILPDAKAGEKGRCKKCGYTFTVPGKGEKPSGTLPVLYVIGIVIFALVLFGIAYWIAS